jgi:hypothetical protein
VWPARGGFHPVHFRSQQYEFRLPMQNVVLPTGLGPILGGSPIHGKIVTFVSDNLQKFLKLVSGAWYAMKSFQI